MSQTPGWDIPCVSCLQNCDAKYLDSIERPYTYAVNASPDYQANMTCVKNCYENQCKGATTWASAMWKYSGGLGSRETRPVEKYQERPTYQGRPRVKYQTTTEPKNNTKYMIGCFCVILIIILILFIMCSKKTE